ncbi:c-type cytochrome [Sulfitobacter sp. BDSS02]|uniref:c-type cytochrome n=1 Tax=Heliomarina TaxID=2917553 RepID=UPI001EE26B54|nr:c-type cytochrome [Heliomarina baculiformis]MBL3702010.1 c-type cytochrome [Sulfitobacter sp. BDSS02]MBR9848360.1 cytochrome c [Paracoccaceae bacterium]
MIAKALWSLPALFIAAACAVDVMPGPDEGEMLFARNCSGCHTATATGMRLNDGTVAPDLTRISERNDGVFPRAHVLSQIDGYGRGKAASVMPEFGDLLEGELVPVEVEGTMTPTPRPLAALMTYLESIQVGTEG